MVGLTYPRPQFAQRLRGGCGRGALNAPIPYVSGCSLVLFVALDVVCCRFIAYEAGSILLLHVGMLPLYETPSGPTGTCMPGTY